MRARKGLWFLSPFSVILYHKKCNVVCPVLVEHSHDLLCRRGGAQFVPCRDMPMYHMFIYLLDLTNLADHYRCAVHRRTHAKLITVYFFIKLI